MWCYANVVASDATALSRTWCAPMQHVGTHECHARVWHKPVRCKSGTYATMITNS